MAAGKVIERRAESLFVVRLSGFGLGWLFSGMRIFMFLEHMLKNLDDSNGINHLIDLRERLKIGLFIFEPPQVVSNQVNVLAALTTDQHNTLVVGYLRERPNALCITLCAGEHQHVQFSSVVVLGTFDVTQQRHCSFCVGCFNLLVSEFVSLGIHSEHFLWHLYLLMLVPMLVVIVVATWAMHVSCSFVVMMVVRVIIMVMIAAWTMHVLMLRSGIVFISGNMLTVMMLMTTISLMFVSLTASLFVSCW